ncbi:TPA: Wzz/FepE/Etk N-terminal domain-containing protein [Photobacterium damselae]
MNDIINNNGINFREILTELWKKKLLLLAIVLVSCLVSSLYAFNKSDIWTSTAIVTNPTSVELSPILKSASSLISTMGDTNKQLNDAISPYNNFNSFISYLNSNDNKLLFITHYPLLENLTDSQKRSLAQTIFSRLDPITKNNYFIETSYNTKEGSQKILADYINFTADRVSRYAYTELNNLRILSLNKLSHQLEQKLNDAKSKLSIDIEKTKYAYSIANKAKITSPIQNLDNNNNLFKIGFGSQGLKEQIMVLESIKDLSIVDPQIAKLKHNITTLSVKLNSSNYKPFRYIDKPTLPQAKTSPSMLKIILMGTFLGFLLGVFIILVIRTLQGNDNLTT